MPVPKIYNETEVLQRVPGSIGDGEKSVSIAGTRVQLGSGTCIYAIICAKPGNTGYIYVGGSTVSATSGVHLVALEKVRVDVDNLDKIYLDADTGGEGVQYYYVY